MGGRVHLDERGTLVDRLWTNRILNIDQLTELAVPSGNSVNRTLPEMKQPQICRPLIALLLLIVPLGCHLGGTRRPFTGAGGNGEQTAASPQPTADRSSAPIQKVENSSAEDTGEIVPLVHIEQPPAGSRLAQWLKRLGKPKRIPLPLTESHAGDSPENEVILENHGLGEF